MKAEVYHTAITVLLDIADECPEAHQEIHSALQFLKKKRFETMKDDIIPACSLTVKNAPFRKLENQNPAP